jgi:hypothetical protein
LIKIQHSKNTEFRDGLSPASVKKNGGRSLEEWAHYMTCIFIIRPTDSFI